MLNFLITIAIAFSTTTSYSVVEPHDFFVSVIEVKHEKGNEETTFRFRIFSDDLQVGLQSEFELGAPPALDGICNDTEDQLQEFLNNHISIRINGAETRPSRVDCTSESDVHEVTWHIDSSPEWETLEIKADYLMDVYPGQTQMVHVTESGQKRTLRLTRRTPEEIIDFRN